MYIELNRGSWLHPPNGLMQTSVKWKALLCDSTSSSLKEMSRAEFDFLDESDARYTTRPTIGHYDEHDRAEL